MRVSLEQLRSLVSAVEAGKAALLAGESNPFDGKNEMLRIAFHFGGNLASQEAGLGGEQLLSVERLLDMTAENKACCRFD